MVGGKAVYGEGPFARVEGKQTGRSADQPKA
jgi:hypothetical protein